MHSISSPYPFTCVRKSEAALPPPLRSSMMITKVGKSWKQFLMDKITGFTKFMGAKPNPPVFNLKQIAFGVFQANSKWVCSSIQQAKVCKLIAAFLSICCCLILSHKILKKESGVFPTQERLSWLCLVINSIQGFLGLLTPFNLLGLLTPTLNHLGLQTPNNGNHSPMNPMSVLSLLCFLRASNRPVMIL
jgi:hypothetical protein